MNFYFAYEKFNSFTSLNQKKKKKKKKMRRKLFISLSCVAFNSDRKIYKILGKMQLKLRKYLFSYEVTEKK